MQKEASNSDNSGTTEACLHIGDRKSALISCLCSKALNAEVNV